MREHLKSLKKKDVASDQFFKCANFLGSNLPGLEDYECPMWLKPVNKNPGSFDKSSYQIDHKFEFSLSHDDSRKNLQALCPCCHAVKTKLFMINKPIKLISICEPVKLISKSLELQYFINLFSAYETNFILTAKELFINFQLFLDKNMVDLKYETSNIKLLLKLRHLKIPGVIKHRNNKGIYYTFNVKLINEWLQQNKYVMIDEKVLISTCVLEPTSVLDPTSDSEPTISEEIC